MMKTGLITRNGAIVWFAAFDSFYAEGETKDKAIGLLEEMLNRNSDHLIYLLNF